MIRAVNVDAVCDQLRSAARLTEVVVALAQMRVFTQLDLFIGRVCIFLLCSGLVVLHMLFLPSCLTV